MKEDNVAVRLCQGRNPTGQLVTDDSVLLWRQQRPKVGKTSMPVTVRESEASSPAAAGRSRSKFSERVRWYDDGLSTAAAG